MTRTTALETGAFASFWEKAEYDLVVAARNALDATLARRRRLNLSPTGIGDRTRRPRREEDLLTISRRQAWRVPAPVGETWRFLTWALSTLALAAVLVLGVPWLWYALTPQERSVAGVVPYGLYSLLLGLVELRGGAILLVCIYVAFVVGVLKVDSLRGRRVL